MHDHMGRPQAAQETSLNPPPLGGESFTEARKASRMRGRRPKPNSTPKPTNAISPPDTTLGEKKPKKVDWYYQRKG